MTASVFAVLSLALGGASCDKKSVANPGEPGPSVPFEAPAAPKVTPGAVGPAAKPAQDFTPPKALASPPGARDKVADLLAKLPSPCAKAMSLAKTLDADPSCKHAPFAKRYVQRLAGQELSDGQITDLYRSRYGEHETATFTTRDTPFLGSASAPVVLVEFFDYACPHCRLAAPILEEVALQHGKDVAVYFKNFPLHKDSMDPAKAALAAARQGKFLEMHKALFAHQGSLARDEVFGYAKELALDMAKFDKDWNDPGTEAKVKADKEEGLKTKLQGTPALFINGHLFEDSMTPDALNEWIEEEITVNR